jgi:hypothetical protein
VCIDLYKCRGHLNVAADHKSTFELERDARLGVRGDCVVCVGCSSRKDGGCASLKGLAALYLVALQLWPPKVVWVPVYGSSPGSKPSRFIVRKSGHRENSLIVEATKASADLPQEVREALASPFTKCLALHVVLSEQAG